MISTEPREQRDVSPCNAMFDRQVDLGETVRAIDNMRLVVHEGRYHAHAQNMVSREADCRSSVSSRGSASAREYQVREVALHFDPEQI